MKHIIALIFILFSWMVSAQKIGADVIKFQGNVTTTIRDTYDVPTGEYWLIYNTTTTQLEVSDDTDSWSAFEAGTDDQTAAEVAFTPYSTIASTDVQAAIQEVLDEAAAGIATGDIDTSAEIAAIVTDETGSGALVFGTSPTLVTPALGTPSALVLTNATGLVSAGIVDGTIVSADISDGTVAGIDILDETIETGDIADGTILEGDLNISNAPTAGYSLTSDGTTGFTWSSAGTGDVTAASSFGTDNILIRSDGTGKGVQSSGITISDANSISGVNDIDGISGDFSSEVAAPNFYAETSVIFTPTDTEPSGSEGRLYADDSENRPKYYDGTSWKAVLLTGDVAGGGLSDIVDDTTPQLGGNLDLNSNSITGTGSITASGSIQSGTWLQGQGVNYEVVGGLASIADRNETGFLADNVFGWKKLIGEIEAFWDFDGLTADRTYTLPNASGTVMLTTTSGATDDQTADEVPFTPYSTIASTNVQAAIQEVLDESAGGLSAASIDTSAELAAILTDETGSAGSVVFSANPTLTGTPVLPASFTMGANAFGRSGAHDLTFTTTGTTAITLPTTGTMITTSGTATLTNKTIAFANNTLTNVMSLTTAQSVTAGIKKTFQADATNAGLRLAGVTASPSTLVAGDMWYRTDTEKMSYRGASGARSLVDESITQTLTNKTIDGDNNTILDVIASEVNIVDSGGNYTGTEVETALTEIAADIATNASAISDNGAEIATLSAVGSSQFGFVTYTANQSLIAGHLLDSVAVVMNGANLTYTIEQSIASSGNSVRIINGATGKTTIAAGTGTSFTSFTMYKPFQAVTIARMSSATGPEVWQIIDGAAPPKSEFIQIALSDMSTAVTTGTTKGYFYMPYAAELLGVKVTLNAPGTATGITVDINEGGTSVLSTKLTTDATEATSDTAATAAVISDSSLADNAKITFDFDAVPTAGSGVIVELELMRL